MKKLLSLLFALVTPWIPMAQEEKNEPKSPQNVIFVNQNTLQTHTSFYISEDGIAYVYLDYMGYHGITEGASILIEIEKENGTFRKHIHSEHLKAEGEYYYHTWKYPLAEEGVYDCRVTYTVSGIGTEDDIITFEDRQTYFPIKNETLTPIAKPNSPSEEQIFERAPFVSLGTNKKHLTMGDSVLFLHSEQGHIENGILNEERYLLGDFFGLYRYDSAHSLTTLYCEKPNCPHLSCSAVSAYGELFSIGGNIYQMQNGTISMILPDGSKKTVWSSDGNPTKLNEKGLPIYAVGWRNPLVYGEYLYITANDENGKAHILQFDAKSGTMSDLTANTGNFIHYQWIYDGTLYGLSEDRTEALAYDLFLQKEKPVTPEIKEMLTKDFRIHFIREEIAFGILYDEKGESLGIMRFHIKTGESKLLSNDILGAKALAVLYANEEDIWFLDADHRGVILRTDMNATKIRTVFADETMHICAHQMIFNENHILVYAQKIGMIGGKETHYADGFYIGSLDENGNILNLRWTEAAQS